MEAARDGCTSLDRWSTGALQITLWAAQPSSSKIVCLFVFLFDSLVLKSFFFQARIRFLFILQTVYIIPTHTGQPMERSSVHPHTSHIINTLRK